MKYTSVLSYNSDKLILVDADIMYNRAAFSCESAFTFEAQTLRTVEDADVVNLFHRLLMGVLHNLRSDRYILCWSSTENFRTTVLPTYKENRTNVRRPVVGAGVKHHLKLRYPGTEVFGLEADDIMGLLSKVGETIIASDDKDLLTVPGMVYKPRKPELGVLNVCEDEAKYNWYQQILMGDRTDGYNGIPGIGEKKSEKILAAGGTTWNTVVNAYEFADLSEEDAVVTAQVSRILRDGEWDYGTNAPRLWTP